MVSIAHLSDAHLGPLPQPTLADLASKRLTGYVNWRRGRHIAHDMGVLGAIVADIAAHRPDHVAFTGDVANIGLAAEFPAARRFLERLGPPAKVSFVPGNHDNYVRSSAAPLYRALGPWMSGDDASATAKPTFPYLRRRDGVALIGTNSAIPTLPFLASGRLGPQQLAELADLLGDLRREGLCRIVMIHHAPYRSATSPARQLIDAAAFARVLAQVGAELILHGHNHRIQLTHLAGPDRAVPVLGAPSASAYAGSRQHRAGYHLVDITPDGARSSIVVRSRGLKPGGQIAELTGLGEISTR